MRTVRCSGRPWVGVSACRGCLPAGGGGNVACLPGVSACQTPPLWTEWQTRVKTLPCQNYFADGNKKLEDISPFLAPAISLFRTYGDDYPGFQTCNTCWSLDGQHGNRAFLIHVLVHAWFLFQSYFSQDVVSFLRQHQTRRSGVSKMPQ